MVNKLKLTIQDQGRVVVEYDYELQLYLVMTPDGQVSYERTRKQVERLARLWAKKHADNSAIGVMYIDWRDCPPEDEVKI